MSDTTPTPAGREMVTITISTLQEHPFEWTIPKKLETGEYKSTCLFFNGISLEILYFCLGSHKFVVRFPLIVEKSQRSECNDFTHSRSYSPPRISDQGSDDGEVTWVWQLTHKSLGNPQEMEKLINDGLSKACYLVPVLLEMIVKKLTADDARVIYDRANNPNQ